MAVAGLCWVFWYGALRGRASGEQARYNAESEAARYLTMTHGEVPHSVVCVPHTGEEVPSEVPGNTFDMSLRALHAENRPSRKAP